MSWPTSDQVRWLMADQQKPFPPPPPRLPVDEGNNPATAAAVKHAWPEKPSLLGTRVSRVDGPNKVTGRGKYTFDINRPGMLYAKVIRSPHPHARIVSID